MFDRTPDEPELSIETIQSGALAVVQLHGELDLQSDARFRAAVEAAIDRGPVVIAIDLRRLEFMDSSGLRALLLVHTRCQSAGLRCFVIRGSRQVSRLLQIAGVEDVLEIVDSPEAISA